MQVHPAAAADSPCHPLPLPLGEALPQELLSLQDAAAPVQLPVPGSVPPSSLDNWKLDKLVAALGRSRCV